MNHYIEKLIEQGEHLRQDFKFAINDSRKIARSLVAFANTEGGRLLVGVKDNGKIAGVRTSEEFHMIEAASQLYTKPEVYFETKAHIVSGKQVLEIIIPKSEQKPHSAPDINNNYKVFIRVADQNLLANGMLLKIWKQQKSNVGVKIKYSENEKLLLDYLTENESITFSKYCRIVKISRFKAEKILVNLIVLDIIEIVFTDKLIFYRLKAK